MGGSSGFSAGFSNLEMRAPRALFRALCLRSNAALPGGEVGGVSDLEAGAVGGKGCLHPLQVGLQGLQAPVAMQKLQAAAEGWGRPILCRHGFNAGGEVLRSPSP